MANNYKQQVQDNNDALRGILDGINELPVAQPITSRTYEITLAKSSGWVLLTALDDDVLVHINDPSLTVVLSPLDAYALVGYDSRSFFACNSILGYSGEYSLYGYSSRQQDETKSSPYQFYYPANKTDTSTGLGGFQLRVSPSGNYYFRPGDGYVAPGTYRLVFQW